MRDRDLNDDDYKTDIGVSDDDYKTDIGVWVNGEGWSFRGS